MGVTHGRDPNALHGPAGQVAAGQSLAYTAEFENVGEGIVYGVYVRCVQYSVKLNSNVLQRRF